MPDPKNDRLEREDQDLLNFQVPHSIEAEQAVLGAMLIDSRCIPDVMGILQPDDFYVKKNKEIFIKNF